ncbi:hypothetical protein [Mycolicibacterium celeriflavum]|uniref:hypothetical protein n=1 Tax=Mycolicibacterium celeriflavum TaxID=1249101 RepID=UPI0013D1FBF0|nr:hypothetical protein [Mycolicibacterium celeriflavum]MCV7240789.1 hypothetical protein [Mycolicibacterium celeriflavum]
MSTLAFGAVDVVCAVEATLPGYRRCCDRRGIDDGCGGPSAPPGSGAGFAGGPR